MDEMRPRMVWLVDLENVAGCLEDPVLWSEEDLIFLFHGASEPRVPLGQVRRLGEAMARGQVTVVAMPTRGPQAADMALAVHAGCLHERMPPEVPISILSCDKAFDHVVAALKALGRNARRLPHPPAPAGGADVLARAGRAAAWLENLSAPPLSLKTLRRSLGKRKDLLDGLAPGVIIEALASRGILAILPDQRIEYSFEGSPEAETSPFDAGVEDMDVPF